MSNAPEPNDSDQLRRVVFGTAGHIDHGKTTLLKALTGIDCDRWIEEKERGITIDIGFAHLREGDLQVGFVDVPGHHRFLHNALAGLGGIRVVLLVVAATEGVMPQTREHLAICSVLGIPAALVVLTKTDLASTDLLELAELDVEELLENTPYADSPIMKVSSTTGEGIPELRGSILELAERFEVVTDEQAPVRLPVDRAFHLQGRGVIVTGTLASGCINTGDALSLLPAGQTVRARSVQIHGQSREQALSGERTSLQVAGIDLEEVGRGMQLVTPEAFRPSTLLAARLTLLADAPAPLKRSMQVRLYHYASEVLGRVSPIEPRRLEPGQTGLVELRLATPALAIRGDRVILRRPSPAATLGGGQIIDPAWRRRRGFSPAGDLKAIAGDRRQALCLWIERQGPRGLATRELAWRLGSRVEPLDLELAALAEAGELIEVPADQGHPRAWVTPSAYERVKARAAKVLKDYFRRDQLAMGIPKAEAVRRILPAVTAHLIRFYLSRLEEQRILVVHGELVNLPGRKVELGGPEAEFADAILERLEAEELTPPARDVLCSELGAQSKVFNAAARFLVDTGKLVRLPNNELLAASAFETMRKEMAAEDWPRFSVPQFKDRFGLTRKWAIPILEYCDSVGFTRRVGNERIFAR
ncbi:MAG: selenocysteine-specific translation elongation factor [bacterium]|nr:selenocysteine-specific translation elongation factor [bacterium]